MGWTDILWWVISTPKKWANDKVRWSELMGKRGAASGWESAAKSGWESVAQQTGEKARHSEWVKKTMAASESISERAKASKREWGCKQERVRGRMHSLKWRQRKTCMTSVIVRKMTCLAKSGETGNSIHSNSDFYYFHGSSDMYGCVSIKKLKKIENNFFSIFYPLGVPMPTPLRGYISG